VRVLIVEDEDAIAEPLLEGLSREGFEVDRAATGQAALDAREADLVLLDLRLPDLDGLEVCRRLRERSRVPIIVVSARGEEVDRVVGLELGADDYVVKPYGIRELLARINAVMRRLEPRPPDSMTMRVDGLEVDSRALMPPRCERLAHWRGVERRGERGLRVRSSPDRLGQILDNLVANAVAVSDTVGVSVSRDDGWVELHVVDHGPGLSDEERARAFDRFWRGRATGSGSGLGLAIVRRLADADGGDAELREAPSGGVDAVVRLRSA
jgi:CheY-like chemotaxis protein